MEKEKEKSDLSEKRLVGEGAIDVRGVEEGDATLNSMVDKGDHVCFWFWKATEGRHAHAPEALCGHLKTLRTQFHPPLKTLRTQFHPPNTSHLLSSPLLSAPQDLENPVSSAQH